MAKAFLCIRVHVPHVEHNITAAATRCSFLFDFSSAFLARSFDGPLSDWEVERATNVPLHSFPNQ